MPKVATMYITFITLLLAFFRFPFGTRFQYVKELFIYLTTFAAWLCYCIALHTAKNMSYNTCTRHGKIFAHILVMCSKPNHYTSKNTYFTYYCRCLKSILSTHQV